MLRCGRSFGEALHEHRRYFLHSQGGRSAQFDSCQVVAHFIRLVAKSVDTAGSDLAVIAVSPAFEGGVVQHRTRVTVAASDCDRGAACTQVDGFQVVAHLIRTVTKTVSATGSELAIDSPSPAFDVTTVQHRTRVKAAGSDCDRGAVFTQVDGFQVVAHLIRAVTKTVSATGSELAIDSPSPAFDVTTVQQRTRMCATGGDCDRCAACT